MIGSSWLPTQLAPPPVTTRGKNRAELAPFPGGYVAELAVWAVAAFGGLGLSAGRAAVLFAYLAASSLVTRLVVAGVLAVVGN